MTNPAGALKIQRIMRTVYPPLSLLLLWSEYWMQMILNTCDANFCSCHSSDKNNKQGYKQWPCSNKIHFDFVMIHTTLLVIIHEMFTVLSRSPGSLMHTRSSVSLKHRQVTAMNRTVEVVWESCWIYKSADPQVVFLSCVVKPEFHRRSFWQQNALPITHTYRIFPCFFVQGSV